jgi:hypothetical protein
MQLMTLTEIRRSTQEAIEARVHVQVEGAWAKVTREQKPHCE